MRRLRPARSPTWPLLWCLAASGGGGRGAGAQVGFGDGGATPAGEMVFYIDGKPLPFDEGAVLNQLHDMMDKLHWTSGWEEGDTAQNVFGELERLADAVMEAPYLALGLGQVFLLYFWWTGEGLEVNVRAARLSATLHYISVRFAGCDDPMLPEEVFQNLQCSWRWRHVLMIPLELGVHLAKKRSDPRLAATLLREAENVFAMMQKLPYFRRPEWSIRTINTNSDFFPGPVNRPVWPRGSVPFADFLEEHAAVFGAELDAMVADGRFDNLYWSGEVSQTQFGPKHDSWIMVSLVKNKKLRPKACEAAPKTCELLATRPELMECSAGDVGATFARLNPGQGLRPHFWNAPRLGFHLGLHVPPGASMHVGGEQVVWEKGRAVIFDDTYPHSVLHEGTEPRFILLGWFCHPCDRKLSAVAPARPEPLCPPVPPTAASGAQW